MNDTEREQFENFWETVISNPPGEIRCPSGVIRTSTELQAIHRDIDGTELGRIVVYDKCVTNLMAQTIALAMSTSTVYPFNAFKYHHSGTGTDAEKATDTGLVAGTTASGHIAGTQATATDTCSGKAYVSVATVTISTTSTGLTISEHILCNTTSSTDAKFIPADRTLHSGLQCTNGQTIEYTYKISYIGGS